MTGLNSKTQLFRFIDFFEAAAILQEGRLRFSRTSRFADENEGIDLLLYSLLISKGPCKGAIGFSWHNTEEAIKYHQRSKKCFYACCWTCESDSIALWSLYSPHKLGVRIQTTVGKLRSALDAVQDSESSRFRSNIQEGDVWSGIKNTNIIQVRYANLFHLHKKIERFGKAYERFLMKRKQKNKGEPSFGEGGRDPYERISGLERLMQPFSLKDEAYAHEQEVRALLETGRLAVGFDTAKVLTSAQSVEHVEDVKQYLTETSPLEEDMEFVSIGVPNDFVESICIDPRSPPHWKSYMRNHFEQHKCKVVDSNAFGYAIGQLSFEISKPVK